MTELHRFIRVDFSRFKAFDQFTIHLRHFNILVGPNNAGKSTILTAFRILAAAIRKASSRSPEIISGPQGRPTPGYSVDLSAIAVAEENIFFNYDDSIAATVRFRLSNKNELILYFPEPGQCYLIFDAQGRRVQTPSAFRSQFNCPIGFVPILGPVEHNEPLFEREAARLALFNYRAARNFRNIWHHYPAKFDEFRAILAQTWPGMDIQPPEPSHDPSGKSKLYMFCPEERIPREIFWAGFGFQVWCQMLTHIIQSNDAALFLIDEPDIYLHSDLQRQLISLLRNMGPDILIATHSTEIVTEAEADDIVLINKQRKDAQRIRHPSQLEQVFRTLGSSLNPILTQLAKTRRVVFVEGKDFQILGKFAKKLGFDSVGNRSDFAVVPVEGFNPERIRNVKSGMETTLGGKIAVAAILDRDYRSKAEVEAIAKQCRTFCDVVTIHDCKEVENFLLIPSAVERAAQAKVNDQSRRTGFSIEYLSDIKSLLDNFAMHRKSYVLSQYLADRKRFERVRSPNLHEASVNEAGLIEFEQSWRNDASRLEMVPGKEALSVVNQHLQEQYGVNLTATAIVDAMKMDEIPINVAKLVSDLSKFAKAKAPQT